MPYPRIQGSNKDIPEGPLVHVQQTVCTAVFGAVCSQLTLLVDEWKWFCPCPRFALPCIFTNRLYTSTQAQPWISQLLGANFDCTRTRNIGIHQFLSEMNFLEFVFPQGTCLLLVDPDLLQGGGMRGRGSLVPRRSRLGQTWTVSRDDSPTPSQTLRRRRS